MPSKSISGYGISLVRCPRATLDVYNIFFRRVSYRIPLGCAMTLSISDGLKWVYIVTITIGRWKLGQKKKIRASDQVQENIG